MAQTVRDWSAEAVRKYLAVNGRHIKLAALRGDQLSIAVMNAYWRAYRENAPDGSPAALNLRDALNDYVLRDLNIREREILAGKFGHYVEPETPGKIMVPVGVRH